MNKEFLSLGLLIIACLITILNLDFDNLFNWKINGETYIYSHL